MSSGPGGAPKRASGRRRWRSCGGRSHYGAGPALAGLGGRIIQAGATAWDERRYAAAEDYYDHQLARGRHREVLGELSALVAQHPLRERPAGQLMIALYRSGRQADALSLYSDTRARLAAELGLDPGPELQRLQQQMLTADPALAPARWPSRPRVLTDQIRPGWTSCRMTYGVSPAATTRSANSTPCWPATRRLAAAA